MSVKRIVLGLVALALICGAGFVLFGILRALSVEALFVALRATSARDVVLCVLATCLSFASLGYYEVFATEVVAPGKVETRYAFWVGVISHAIANTLGFHVITGGALRYRLFSAVGLDAADIARVTVIVGVCVGLGSISMLAAAAVVGPQVPTWGRALGFAGLVALFLAITLFPTLSRQFRLRRISLPKLHRRALLIPMGIGLVEASATILAFYALLPADLAADFVRVAVVVLAALLVGVVSHSPGGVGVFEAGVLSAFPEARHAEILAALLLYRLFYNLLPFLASTLSLVVQQARVARASVRGRV